LELFEDTGVGESFYRIFVGKVDCKFSGSSSYGLGYGLIPLIIPISNIYISFVVVSLACDVFNGETRVFANFLSRFTLFYLIRFI